MPTDLKTQACKKENNHRYYERHKDEIRAKGRQYHRTHPLTEIQKARKKAWSKIHGKLYRQAHPLTAEQKEQRKKALHKWISTHRERHKQHGRNHHLKKKYQITGEHYDLLLHIQRGKCGICGTMNIGKKKHFSIDHCHATGIIRGLLCNNCNVALGLFGDNPGRLANALAWIKGNGVHIPT